MKQYVPRKRIYSILCLLSLISIAYLVVIPVSCSRSGVPLCPEKKWRKVSYPYSAIVKVIAIIPGREDGASHHGHGVVCHSSKAKGTYILTAAHVISNSKQIFVGFNKASLSENADAILKTIVEKKEVYPPYTNPKLIKSGWYFPKATLILSNGEIDVALLRLNRFIPLVAVKEKFRGNLEDLLKDFLKDRKRRSVTMVSLIKGYPTFFKGWLLEEYLHPPYKCLSIKTNRMVIPGNSGSPVFMNKQLFGILIRGGWDVDIWGLIKLAPKEGDITPITVISHWCSQQGYGFIVK